MVCFPFHPSYSPADVTFEGDVIHLNVVGNHVVVLNSQAAASDLLEKKSAIYSSRGRHAVFELWVPVV